MLARAEISLSTEEKCLAEPNKKPYNVRKSIGRADKRSALLKNAWQSRKKKQLGRAGMYI